MTNRHGTILSEPSQISRVLGTTIYEFLRNWSEFRSRFVDREASTIGAGYTGCDVPEMLYQMQLLYSVAAPANAALPPSASSSAGELVS
ncbi:MAG TPA: hypothetical protein VK137_05265 [Planctomycetaceae bacterium]|nr:hypothetical protein [Planctomycetaceae bacterium]